MTAWRAVFTEQYFQYIFRSQASAGGAFIHKQVQVERLFTWVAALRMFVHVYIYMCPLVVCVDVAAGDRKHKSSTHFVLARASFGKCNYCTRKVFCELLLV